MVRIRLATAADDPAIGELLVDSFVRGYAEKMPEVVVHDRRKRDLRDVAAKRAAGRVWVAEKDGVVVGTATVYGPGSPGAKTWDKQCGELRYFAIDLGLRGGVVSDPLIAEVLADARREGWPGLTLHVRRGATGVARFYEKHGFSREPTGDRDEPEIYLEAYAIRF